MCEKDGGYYAIKGFLYQFDKTILEILSNPNKQIFIEHIQDINYDDYVIQVKHKESANFTYSKIKAPVIQLLQIYKKDNTKKLCLHCYFKDKKPEKYIITAVDELDNILKYKDKEKNESINLEFSNELKHSFISNFVINFSDDYEGQFLKVIDKIKESFEISHENEALLCHSIIRAKLLNLALKENPSDRSITKSELDTYIKTTKDHIFYSHYRTYLGRDKYIKFMKSQYFIHKSANINCFERLFIIDFNEYANLTVLNRIVSNISNKYFKLNKSPAPYICLRGADRETINELKRELLDDNIVFADGTCFDGDKFRIEKLIEDANRENKIVVKLIDEDRINNLVEKITVKEFYHLFLTSPLNFPTKYHQVKVQIEKCDEILEMIC